MIRTIITTIRFLTAHPLTKNNKIKTLLHFLRWQIGARLLNENVIIPWVDDSKLIASIGETGATGNLYTGLMEYEDMLFLLHALQPTEIFVDIGANIGAYTILASKVVNAQTIAFEPIPTTFEKLKDQIQINQINHLVTLVNKGVGEKNQTLFFTNNKNTMNKVSVIGEANHTSQVEVITLDGELDKNKNYFFKIDVEGFESNVIEGAHQILSSPNVLAIILELNGSGHEFGHSNELLHNQIIRYNFFPVSYNPIDRSLSVLSSYNKNNKNTIYINDINLIRTRCLSAAKRCIHTAHDVYV
jgi:FkbM family methyltransferase